jgi:DNA adenine methylase
VRYLSPLRYPGGKARLAAFVGDLISDQRKSLTRYVEPFAGGAAVGLHLLYQEYVDEIVLNDLDPGIAAFWRAVFNESDLLIERVQTTKPSIEEWHRQKAIHSAAKDADPFDLGFATFFLNRTNRSGIIGARPIGGLDQTGQWLIDARYRREDLAARIEQLAAYATRVTITEMDGVDLAAEQLKDHSAFVYADPPYLSAGDDLYLNALAWADHERLAAVLRGSNRWLLTYDADSRIPNELYPELRCAAFDLAHTAAKARIGREFAVFSDDLLVKSIDGLGRDGGIFLSEMALT